MNKTSQSLGLGALVLALASCKGESLNQRANELTPDEPKLEQTVNEFGDVVGSSSYIARRNLTEATRHWNLKYWDSPDHQVLDESTQSQVIDAILSRAVAIADYTLNYRKPQVFSHYFIYAKELAEKNGINLPEDRLIRTLTRAVNGAISYELGIAKSRIVDHDFPSSAEAHLNSALTIAQKFGVDIPHSQHSVSYNEVRGLLLSRYGIMR